MPSFEPLLSSAAWLPSQIPSRSGDCESKVAQLLRFARHQARVAQTGAAPRMQDALTGLEDAISDHLVAFDNAAADDKADTEASGEAERQAWLPLRAV
jgi:hypothetical protein